jgi:hypothetical protein
MTIYKAVNRWIRNEGLRVVRKEEEKSVVWVDGISTEEVKET